MMLLPVSETIKKPINYLILLLNLKDQSNLSDAKQKPGMQAYEPFNVNYIPCANSTYTSVLC